MRSIQYVLSVAVLSLLSACGGGSGSSDSDGAAPGGDQGGNQGGNELTISGAWTSGREMLLVGPDDMVVYSSFPRSNRNSADYDQAILNGYLSSVSDNGEQVSFTSDGYGDFKGRGGLSDEYGYHLKGTFDYDDFFGERLIDDLTVSVTSNGAYDSLTLAPDPYWHQNISMAELAGTYRLDAQGQFLISISQTGAITSGNSSCRVSGTATLYDPSKNLIRMDFSISDCISETEYEGIVMMYSSSSCPYRATYVMNALKGVLRAKDGQVGFFIVDEDWACFGG